MLIFFPILLIINMITIVQKRENKKQKTKKQEPSVLASLYNSLIYNSIKKAGARFCLHLNNEL